MDDEMSQAAHYDLDKMKFNRRAAEYSLVDPSNLTDAFEWKETPQGREYWAKLWSTRNLTSEAKSTIKFMIEASYELRRMK